MDVTLTEKLKRDLKAFKLCENNRKKVCFFIFNISYITHFPNEP